jgi:hypothetical protein
MLRLGAAKCAGTTWAALGPDSTWDPMDDRMKVHTRESAAASISDPARHHSMADPALTCRLAKDRLVNPGFGDGAHAAPMVGRRTRPELASSLLGRSS